MTAPDLSVQERATVDRIEQAPDALGLREEVEAVLAGHATHVGPVSGSWTCPPPCNAMSTNGSIETGDLTGRDERAAEYRAHLADALLPLFERREAEAAKRALLDAADQALACVCGHGFDWHHEERGCQYHGNGPSRCRCLRDAATAVHATLHARADRLEP